MLFENFGSIVNKIAIFPQTFRNPHLDHKLILNTENVWQLSYVSHANNCVNRPYVTSVRPANGSHSLLPHFITSDFIASNASVHKSNDWNYQSNRTSKTRYNKTLAILKGVRHYGTWIFWARGILRKSVHMILIALSLSFMRLRKKNFKYKVVKKNYLHHMYEQPCDNHVTKTMWQHFIWSQKC